MFKPIVVASLPVRSREDIKRVDEIESDLVELRLDYAKDLPEPEEILSYKNKVLVTLRDRGEGGVGDFSDDKKKAFLSKLADLGILYDVEASFLMRREVEFREKVVSAHYFDRLPTREEIDALFRTYSQAFTVKIAVSDLPGYREVLAYVSTKQNATFMPMSQDPLERLALSLLGSKLLYTYIDSPTARGQLNYLEAKRILDCIFK